MMTREEIECLQPGDIIWYCIGKNKVPYLVWEHERGNLPPAPGTPGDWDDYSELVFIAPDGEHLHWQYDEDTFTSPVVHNMYSHADFQRSKESDSG